MEPNIEASNFYERLGLPVDASEEEIRRQYRRLALRYHPDKNPDDPLADENFKRLAEAYECLSNTAQRAAYDRDPTGFGRHQGAAANQNGGEGGMQHARDVYNRAWGRFAHDVLNVIPRNEVRAGVVGAVAGGVLAALLGGGGKGVALGASVAPALVIYRNRETVINTFLQLANEDRALIAEDVKHLIEFLSSAREQ